jgi:hypothetical protein
MIMVKVIKIILILISLNVQSQTNKLFPFGWSTTDRNDYFNEDSIFFKDKIPNYLTIDMNGDKIDDQAWILINRSKNRFGLFVKLSSKKNILKLQEYPIKSKDNKINMGISIVQPGKYLTACGKGYGNCKPEEPKEIEISKPSINFYLFESANSYFYWDENTKEFKHIWISD